MKYSLNSKIINKNLKTKISNGIKIGMIFAVLMMIFLPAVQALAGTNDYTVLAPLPGTTDCYDDELNRTDCETTLTEYLPGMFKLLIGLAAVAAVLMIVWGGITYMTTDAIFQKEEGRKRIKNAVFGLVCVIGAWLILNTINPNLLNINLNITPAITTAPPGGVLLGGELSAGTGKALPWYPLTQAQVDTNNAMKKDLFDNYKVGTNAGPCTTQGQTTGCTNLVGMPPAAFGGVTELKKVCGNNCSVTITGGTEGGHASHGPNIPILDLDDGNQTLNDYIVNHKMKAPEQTSLGLVYTVQLPSGRNATFLRESSHWHVVFGGN